MRLLITAIQFIRNTFLALTLLAAALPVYAVDDTDTAPSGDKAARALSIIEIFTWSNTLPRDLIDLQNSIEDNTVDITGMRNPMPDLSKKIKDLEWQATLAKTKPELSNHELVSLQSKLFKVKAQIDGLNRPIKGNVVKLESWYREWLNRESDLQRFQIQEQDQPDLHTSLPELGSLQQVIDTALNLIEEHLTPNLLTGKEIGELQTRVYLVNDTVSDLLRESSILTIQQTSPSMFSAQFYRQFSKRQLLQAWQNLRLFFIYQLSYVQEHLASVLGSLVLILILAVAIQASRTLVEISSRWYGFASRPFVTALFMAGIALSIFTSLTININLPPNWNFLLRLPLVISVAMLTDLATRVPWQGLLLKRLSLLLAGTGLLLVIGLPQSLFYLIVFYVLLLGFCYYFYLFIRRRRSTRSKNVTWAAWLWGLFPLAIIAFGVTGYDQLAVLIYGRVLTLIISTLSVFLLMQLVSALFELALFNFPSKFVRNNATVSVRQMAPMLALLHGLLWLATSLMILLSYPTLGKAFEVITSIQVSVYSLTITPGSILMIVFICYATLLCSRGIRAFLLQEILPSHHVDKGVQVSIARLVHYAILTVGVLILFKILGFSLSQITIIGGALGVGIGFGLQAIINNFVSGLILLFERPIKVGDMIEVDQEVGEIKELGLRATTVQTFDNAEIVIPNSELITGSVTNWTLAEKRARIRVPVGVAYGTDIANVFKILLSCAEENASVLSQPKPQALFLAFGSSSLDFELRVWISDVTERFNVLSELNQDIENEFSLGQIEIPFPQTDLHLRSVDREAASALNKTTTE